MPVHRGWWNWPALTLSAVLASAGPVMGQQGLVLSAVGPVNRSMGGASAAAPIDASGALHWNPAAISGLGRSEVEVGLELAYPHARLASAVGEGALGPGVPPVPLAGSDKSDSGVSPLPTIGLVYLPEECAWAFGLGIFTIGGFSVNYPASLTNPILTPQPPNGLGLGALFSEFQVLQLAPTVAYQVTEHISIGFAPTLDLATLRVDPALFASPDDANGDGRPTYPSGSHSRYHWGVGFQAGVYYTTDVGWKFGASVKSPQWFEKFGFQSADELGRPRSLRFDLDYPMIVTLGAAYGGFERFLIAADVRYIDYSNTDGFRSTGFDPSGAVRGVGWDSIVAVDLGVQYQLSDPLSLGVGYSYNQNPIDDPNTTFNLASPTVTEHMLAGGASYQVTEAWKVSLAYVHVFANSIRGPIQTPLGPAPGTSVSTTASADSVSLGASVQF
jgi:long-chain fatty acid transport protein